MELLENKLLAKMPSGEEVHETWVQFFVVVQVMIYHRKIFK